MIHLHERGGPYASHVAALGGVPAVIPDVPICACFLAIYIGFAATNLTIFRRNLNRHHKFFLTMLLTAFSGARIGTLVLRIAWANREHNIRLSIAANIFVNAGILIIYILNLALAQRILRAMQPQIGWNPVLRAMYKVLYTTIGIALVMVITSVILSFYTLDLHTKQICRDIQLVTLTYLVVFATLPLLHIGAAVLLPARQDAETFGKGSMESKMIIVLVSTLLSMLIAGFRAGVNWTPPRPSSDSPWYDSKACFYVFNFTCEVMILGTLTFSRIDKRFWIPNGSNQPGDYTRLVRNENMEPEAEEEYKANCT